MKYSKNYSLYLPEDTDPVKVSDLSTNFEKLDAIISSNITNEVSGTLALAAINPPSAGSATSTTTLSLGKPIKKITFRLTARATASATGNTLGTINGPEVTVTPSSGASSGGSFDRSSGTYLETYSINASIPALSGESSVPVTLSASLAGGGRVISGSITYFATVGG